MKLKYLGLALAAVMALSAVTASAASASPVTKKSQWEIGETAVSTPQSVVCSKKGTSNLVLSGTVLEAPTKLEATGVKCVEATISNEVVSSENMAVDAGKLEFTGVKVVEPAGCTVAETLTTEALKTRLYMDSTTTTKVFDRFEPAAGETGKFISIKISGCAIAGTYPVKGFTYGEAENATGVLASNQPLAFNAATNEVSTLTLGGNPAKITGEANNELASGAAFRATEK